MSKQLFAKRMFLLCQTATVYFVVCLSSAYIPQKQKASFDFIISSSQQESERSDIDSNSTAKDPPWKTTPTAAATGVGNKVVGQPR